MLNGKWKTLGGHIEIQCVYHARNSFFFFFFHFHTLNVRAWPVACSTVLHDGSVGPFYFDT